MFDNISILVTGGTGSFGHAFIRTLLTRHRPHKLIIFSRDELKQFQMQQEFDNPCLRYFIGDVRDRDRLYRAFKNVDLVVHAAALKQVPACEYNPMEAVRTNVLGASNVIDAAIDCGVDRVIALSTDKAANPINLYGATKLCSDKLFTAGNSYAGEHPTRFSVVRYGNVVGSRGSVVPVFLRLRAKGVLPITDPRMTRFWITLEQGVDFVLDSFQRMRGGEIFVPKIPSIRILDLAAAMAPECQIDTVGIRPGEKLHEVMIPADEARLTREYPDHYTICPTLRHWRNAGDDCNQTSQEWQPCPDGFYYSSDTNQHWLTVADLCRMLETLERNGEGGL